jgi:AmpD protein
MYSVADDGWIHGASFVFSPNFNDRPNEAISLIVIHCISLPPYIYGGKYVEDFFCNNLNIAEHSYFSEIVSLKVSAHVFIKRTGELIQFVSCNGRAWHAGISSFQGRENCNDFSIGIELEGMDDDFFTEQQYDSLNKLLVALKLRYPSIASCVGHSDIAPGRKKDPGVGFDWLKVINI